MPEPRAVWPNTQDFSPNWLYLEQDSTNCPAVLDAEWQRVDLPHTWNAKDTLERKDYRRGISWYRKQLVLTAEDLQQRLFVCFGAAGQEAAVFVNGKPAGEHVGGYSAFTLEITELVRAGHNEIDVRVNNRPNKYAVPLADGLFNCYGGLYRSVQLLRAPLVCLSRTATGARGSAFGRNMWRQMRRMFRFQ